MDTNKLKKKYDVKTIKFRRKWVNLFRDYSKTNKLQPSVVIVFTSFILSLILFFTPLNKISFLPFLLGFLFVLISLIYFRIYPLSWEEMNEEEKKQFRYFYKLPNDWELE